MAITITIGGVDKTSLLVSNSLSISSRLGSRNRASITLTDTAGSYTPSAGSEVVIFNGAVRCFGGFLDQYDESITIAGNTTSKTWVCELVSYDAIADRHLVAQSYENTPTQTLGSIVNSIVTNFLANENLTTTNVSTGPAIDKIKFNYQAASAVFDELANISGFSWWIDESRNLYFKARSEIVSSVTLTESNLKSVSIRRTFEKYRNRQYIRAGVAQTSARTDSFKGDGTNKTFVLSYEVGQAPTSITVGGVSKTFGVKGVDTGKDWYYQIGSQNITQDDAAAAIGAGVAIVVSYVGQFPILISSQDDTEILEQATLGGGSGIIEAVDDRPNLNQDTAALSVASGLLRRYGKIPRVLTITTDTDGLRAGEIVPITIAAHGISGSWLIDSVSCRDVNGSRLEWTIEALDGESLGGWQEFFAAIVQSAKKIEFRENEVIIYSRPIYEPTGAVEVLNYGAVSYAETVRFSDSITQTTLGIENRADYAQADLSEAG